MTTSQSSPEPAHNGGKLPLMPTPATQPPKAGPATLKKKRFFTPLKITIGCGVLLFGCMVMCCGGIGIIGFFQKDDADKTTLQNNSPTVGGTNGNSLTDKEQLLHPLFVIRPGYDYIYKRRWTVGVSDATTIRRHHSDGVIELFVSSEDGTLSSVENEHYRGENGVLKEALVHTDGTLSEWIRLLLPKMERGDSWEDQTDKTDKGAIRVIHTCEDVSIWEQPPATLSQYAGRKMFRVKVQKIAAGFMGDEKPIRWSLETDTFVEGLGLVAHEFYRATDGQLAYREELIAIKETR